MPIADQMRRALSPTGTFILNIKEAAVNGERHTYVIELILALTRNGWAWTQEYVWHKSNCYPGRWPNRFRDAWERVLQFNHPGRQHRAHPGKEPTSSVLWEPTECSNRAHSAASPLWLPAAMIRKYTEPGDTVLDPFAGSGTTVMAALDLRRRAVAIEIDPAQCEAMTSMVNTHSSQPPLL